MLVCKQCGVELEHGEQVCPLCKTPVIDGQKTLNESIEKRLSDTRTKPKILKHILWQIACVLLLSGIFATLAINLAIIGHVTWSIYPVTICLIILSYASLIALWETKPAIQLISGWMLSCIVLATVQFLAQDDWPLSLTLPILSAITLISMSLIGILNNLQGKGLITVAVVFIGVSVACFAIEAILSLYSGNKVQLGWSVVVSACMLPVTAAIIFMHFRTRSDSNAKKIFHT